MELQTYAYCFRKESKGNWSCRQYSLITGDLKDVAGWYSHWTQARSEARRLNKLIFG